MKAPYLLIVFLSTFYFSTAQNIKGTVLDEISKQPIEGVHVYLKTNSEGTLTNSKGEFIINFKSNFNETDKLYFSFVGFETKVVNYSDIKKEHFVVRLKKEENKLNEIRIISKDQLNKKIRFDKLASMKKGTHSFGSVMVSDKIYVAGGDGSFFEDSNAKLLERYPDISFSEFINKGRINYSIERYQDEFLIYDIQKDTWEISDLKFNKRAYHNMNYHNGAYYILGGKRLAQNKKKEYLEDRIEVLNEKDKTIKIDFTNPHQAVNFTSIIYNDNLIVMGGSTKLLKSGRKEYSEKVHLYDLESGYWYELGEMPKPKEVRSILIENKIYLIGGFNQKPLNEIETFDLEKGNWEVVGYLFEGISLPAIAHNSGVIYFFENGKIYTYNIERKELKEYLVDLFLQNSTMYFFKDKLYIVGGFVDKNYTIKPSRSVYSIYLNEFDKTKINKYKTL